MSLLSWGDQYSVGIARVDVQHRRLFEMVNEMHEAMRTGQGNEVLGKILDSLVAYTKTHFAEEERLMQSTAFPGYAEHKAAHDALTQQVLDLQKKYKAGAMVMSVEVMLFLKNWLSGHILGMDMKYGPHIKAKGAA